MHVKIIMKNDFKMLVFEQHNIKVKVSCSANR